MIRFLFVPSFALGAIAAIWATLILPPGNPVALVAIALIVLVYITGFLELRRFRHDTQSLHAHLQRLPTTREALDTWLAGLPSTLCTPVHRRIQGAPNALPGPSLTPYLTGLLVMLGLLGTFIGMIVTLRGAVSALQGGADLQAMRAALAAPIAGMSLAFGTSIAGVATSAMLGLAAALSRRERLAASRDLDLRAHHELATFSWQHQRQETDQVLRDQARHFPAVAEQLHALTERLEQTGQQLAETLTTSQAQFQQQLQTQHSALADTLSQALDQRMAETARLTAEQARQTTAQALAQFNEQTNHHQQQQATLAEQQLTNQSRLLRDTTAQISEQWQAGIQALITQTSDQLHALHQQNSEHASAALERLDHLEQSAAQQLSALGQALEAPMTRLIDTASQAPEAAAQVIRQLRAEMTRSDERDNELLAERQRILSELEALLGTQQDTAKAQQTAIETLLRDAGSALNDASQTFIRQVQTQSGQLDQVTAELTGSGHDIASLSDAFATGVEQFDTTTNKLIARLEQAEAALTAAGARSDDQLAYYVEQAREVIDLSLTSQKDVLDTLSTLHTGNKE